MTSSKNKNWKFPKAVFTVFLVVFFALYIQYAYLSLSPSIYGINMEEFAAKKKYFFNYHSGNSWFNF